MEAQRAEKAILDATKENGEFDMIKKVDQHKKNPHSTKKYKADPSRVTNTVEPYMNLTAAWHLEQAAEDVGVQTTLKMFAVSQTGQ